jgi:hypothetical protein
MELNHDDDDLQHILYLNKTLKYPMTRIIYELEINSIKYHFKKNEDDLDSLSLLGKILRVGRYPTFKISQPGVISTKKEK